MGRSRETGGTPPPRVCAACGRAMEYRKRWARNWDTVRYCSDACRRRGVGPEDRALERRIVELLSARPASATLCPGEVARAHAGEGPWRPLLEPVRRAARRLVAEGRVVILQKGRVVDPSTARGPIRLGRGPGW